MRHSASMSSADGWPACTAKPLPEPILNLWIRTSITNFEEIWNNSHTRRWPFCLSFNIVSSYIHNFIILQKHTWNEYWQIRFTGIFYFLYMFILMQIFQKLGVWQDGNWLILNIMRSIVNIKKVKSIIIRKLWVIVYFKVSCCSFFISIIICYISMNLIEWWTFPLITISKPDSKVHGANMGPTCVLLAPGRPYVSPMNIAIREEINTFRHEQNGWHFADNIF